MKKQIENNQINQLEIEQIDLFALLFKLKQKWYICVIGLLIGTAFGAYYNKRYITPMYQSSTLIYTRSSSTSVSLSDLRLSSDLNMDYLVMFKTRPIMLDVIKELDLEMTPSQLASCISVTNIEDTRIIKISVTSADPFLAKDIANCTADRAIEMVKEVDAQSPYIIEDAIASNVPITASIYSSAIKYGVVGFMVACLFVIGFALINDAVENEEDLERIMGLPILASIPEDNIFNYNKRSKRKSKSTTRKKVKK